MTKLLKVSFIILSVSIMGCSSFEAKSIKNWLEDGTKENRETVKKSNR